MVPQSVYSYSVAITGLRRYAIALLLTACAMVLAWITKAHVSCFLLALLWLPARLTLNHTGARVSVVDTDPDRAKAVAFREKDHDALRYSSAP